MKTSNRDAAMAMTQAGASAATDVTGFGFLGHLQEMCQGAGLGAVVDIDSVPVMDGIPELVNMGMVPAGAYRNREYLLETVNVGNLPEDVTLPLFDPQTSGGLLIAVSPERADQLEIGMNSAGVTVHRIGLFHQGVKIKITSGS
jgi:selenide,water dikinase